MPAKLNGPDRDIFLTERVRDSAPDARQRLHEALDAWVKAKYYGTGGDGVASAGISGYGGAVLDMLGGEDVGKNASGLRYIEDWRRYANDLIGRTAFKRMWLNVLPGLPEGASLLHHARFCTSMLRAVTQRPPHLTAL